MLSALIAVIVPITCCSLPCANASTANNKTADPIASVRFTLILLKRLVMHWFRSRRLSAIQKLLLFVFFPSFFGTFGIHLFHFSQLLRRELWQMPNKPNQFPTVLFLAQRVPPRHAAQPNAVLDDEEDFSITELLCALFPHVGGPWIHVRSHFGITAPIVRMTDRAMVGPVHSAGSDHVWRIRHRIAKIPRPAWHRHAAGQERAELHGRSDDDYGPNGGQAAELRLAARLERIHARHDDVRSES